MIGGERLRQDRIDLVAILTPNGSHFEIAKLFAQHDFHILCEKPVTTRVADAIDLIEIQKQKQNVFAVAHAYTGYTMVRHARRLIGDGLLGRLRVVQVDYAQGWLATAVELTGDKVARNRTNPEQNGSAGCLAAIGTHAFNLAEYVTGLELEICFGKPENIRSRARGSRQRASVVALRPRGDWRHVDQPGSDRDWQFVAVARRRRIGALSNGRTMNPTSFPSIKAMDQCAS